MGLLAETKGRQRSKDFDDVMTDTKPLTLLDKHKTHNTHTHGPPNTRTKASVGTTCKSVA